MKKRTRRPPPPMIRPVAVGEMLASVGLVSADGVGVWCSIGGAL